MSSESPPVCPGCGVIPPVADHCPTCDMALGWIKDYPDLERVLQQHAAAAGRSVEETAVPEFSAIGVGLALNRGTLTTLGRDHRGANSYSLADPAIELCHVLIAPWKDPNPNPPTIRFFLLDCVTKIGTWVNRRHVTAVELHSGDFVQIGPFAWSFSQTDGHLVPLAPIAGLGIELRAAHIPKRLGPNFDLSVPPGEFVAIVGESGAGKSTLMKVLAGFENLEQPGRVLLRETDGEEWDRTPHFDRFRQALGYVSQESILHVELSARQILSSSAQLRGRPVAESLLEGMLCRVELKSPEWDRPVRELSGGQNKRVRTASELMGEPRLLLLDEPDSGLDRKTRELLMKLLRTLSWQGCTVVMITHAVADLKTWCNRVVEIGGGQVALNEATSPECRLPLRVPRPPAPVGWWSQSLILAQREAERLWSSALYGIIHTVGVAALFAAAIGIAVPTDAAPLLGFLSIISVLWMSASLSLLAIVGEREVFDHERRLFLSIPSYFSAKTGVFLILSLCQTAVYYLVLLEVRLGLGRDWFFAPGSTFLILALVGSTGIALGLCLSALANRKKEFATSVLPLVMVAQIVFSIPVAEHDQALSSVGEAYRDFHVHRCTRRCGRYGTVWSKAQGWLCDECRHESHNATRDPIRWAAWASYLTISRPADIALRVRAYNDPPGDWSASWALAQIAGWLIGFMAITSVRLTVPPAHS